MKKLLGIVVLGLLLGGNAYADNTTTFKCNFERANYEYTINLYTKDVNELRLLNMRSKDIYHYDAMKRSADITVIEGDRSYNFKGFKNNSANDEHYFFFTDRAASLYAYLVLNQDEGSKPNSFKITSFDSAIDNITKGICEAFY